MCPWIIFVHFATMIKFLLGLGEERGLRWPEEDIFMKNSRAGNLETNGFSGFY